MTTSCILFSCRCAVSILLLSSLVGTTVPKAAAAAAAVTTKKNSVLSCSFPDNFIAFSVFKYSSSTKTIAQVSPEDGAQGDPTLSFSAESSIEHGITYSSDKNGSTDIFFSGNPRLRIPTNSSSSSSSDEEAVAFNDHARWCPARRRLLFVSTRQANPIPNTGWAAVYHSHYDSASRKLLPPTRLTPANKTDYSPSWGPHYSSPKLPGVKQALVAVATGSGAPGEADIAIMAVTEDAQVTERRVVAKNGGWPTWLDQSSILFHRMDEAGSLDKWSVWRVDINTGKETLFIKNALTPSVSDSLLSAPPVVAFAYIEFTTGFRQIGLFDTATKTTTKITEGARRHHYSPYYDPATKDVYFHRCRGGIYPNIRRRRSPDPTLDIATVSGDFPSISPDGSRIATIFANYASFVSIEMMAIDGSKKRTVYNKTHAWQTSWVNESNIAFTAGNAFAPVTDSSVQVAELLVGPEGEAKASRQLTFSDSANNGFPCFSPDGRKIVYRSGAVLPEEDHHHHHHHLGDSSDAGLPGPYHLRVMSTPPPPGAKQHDKSTFSSVPLTPPLTTADAAAIGDTHPHWAENFVVFSSDRGHAGQMSIWTVNKDGSNLTEIFNSGAQNVHPTVLKDGTDRIIFSSTIAEYSAEEIAWPSTFFPRAELFIMHSDGSSLKRLTHDATNQANAYTGLQPLPAKFADAQGSACKCEFLDSTDPLPAAPAPPKSKCDKSQQNKKKNKKPACPFSSMFFAAQSVSDDTESPEMHAVLRKHGVRGKMTSPKERLLEKQRAQMELENQNNNE